MQKFPLMFLIHSSLIGTNKIIREHELYKTGSKSSKNSIHVPRVLDCAEIVIRESIRALG